MSLLTKKIVCITGASRGIGRACAVECAKHGATGLILHYYGDEATTKEVQTLKEEIESLHTHSKVVAVPGDIAQRETSKKIVDEGVKVFSQIGTQRGDLPILRVSDDAPETWERTRQVNLDGAFYITQAVANQMKDQVPQGGSIIGISSISALVGGEYQVHYTPTKAGILSLMQSCAVALGKYNIRANAVLPGTIQTDINKEDLKDVQKREAMVKRTALGRLGAPDDIAGPVVFLASDLSKYMTGGQVLVDGGLFVNLQ
ncbi:NAD-P-binding protein [Daedaleopsis nitida]|nr:NAD-P-binding protein [Daedaleopsis nitida]